MRSIKISVPSGKVKMIMWEGTESEEAFEVKSLKRGTPYIKAYGVKYELTDEEINHIKNLQNLISK